MNKLVNLLILLVLFFSFTAITFAQSHMEYPDQRIFMDGDSSDWAAIPFAVQNDYDVIAGTLPADVSAIANDPLDVKDIKAVVENNAIKILLRFHGGPVWPADLDIKNKDGVDYPRSRGHYHALLDLDNDPETGWKTSHYESDFTVAGFLSTQEGFEDYEVAGAELIVEFDAITRPQYDIDNPERSREDRLKVDRISYSLFDKSPYNGELDEGEGFTIVGFEVHEPDSADGVSWEGALRIEDTEIDEIEADSINAYRVGHGIGFDFIEYSIELVHVKEYFMDTYGQDFFNKGDVVGIVGFMEAPAPDWATEMTKRGEFTIEQDLVPRFEPAFTMDGDNSDWEAYDSALPGEDLNVVAGTLPADVSALPNDILDIKNVKAASDGETMYWMLQFHGGPVWPAELDIKNKDGVDYPRSRGYYHLLVDLDNNNETGWKTSHYESDFTTAGFLQTTEDYKDYRVVGAEIYFGFGATYRPQYEIDDESRSDRNRRPVSSIGWEAFDKSPYNGELDEGEGYTIAEWGLNNPDTLVGGMRSSGFHKIAGTEYAAIEDDTTSLYWTGHAWGYDFWEGGVSLDLVKKYWKETYGEDVFNVGDMIGVAGFIEAPAPEWGTEFSRGGEFEVGDFVTSVKSEESTIINEFKLANNYPNPFNPSTTISFNVPSQSIKVSLNIYNVLGKKVRTLVNNAELSGQQTKVWNGKNDFGVSAPSGIYYYRLESESTSITKSMVLLK